MDTRKLVAVIAAAVVGVGAAITGMILYRKKHTYYYNTKKRGH